jgi:acyl-[acyl-carrier-protein] desaturase
VKNKYRIWTIFWFCTTNGVYTAADYVDIMQKLIDKWNWQDFWFDRWAEKARDYLMKLPGRMEISERLVIPQESHIFKWVEPAWYDRFLNTK